MPLKSPSWLYGNKKALEQLVTHYNNGSVPHSLIFYGPKGIGKASLALNFSNQLINKKPYIDDTDIRRNVSEQSKDAKGILLKVRGNGENYYIHVNTNETIFLPQQYRFYYQASFPTSKNWSEVKIPFSTFKRSSTQISKYFNGKNLKTIGLLAYGRNHIALLEIKYLSFY